MESGVLTPEEAERHPQRSAITRALGTEPTVEVDAFTVEADSGDLFLICSDGLSVMLSDERMAAAIESAERDPHRAADALVAAANAEGGEDNITVVLFEIVEGDAPEARLRRPRATRPRSASTVTSPEAMGTWRTPVAPVEPVEPKRHGAGAGSRIAALALVVALLALCLVVLYLAVR